MPDGHGGSSVTPILEDRNRRSLEQLLARVAILVNLGLIERPCLSE